MRRNVRKGALAAIGAVTLGLITPPVGLNLFVINGIAPDIASYAA